MSGSRAVLLLLLSIVGSIVSTGLSPLTRVALPDFALIVALCGADQSSQRWRPGCAAGCVGAGDARARGGDGLWVGLD